MRRFVTTAVLLLLLAGLAAPALAQKTVKLATLDWEPYIGQKMPGQGYVAQIAVEAFKRSGYDVTIDFLPWARAVADTVSGKYAACFPEYLSEERKREFEFSDPMPGGPLVFFKKADSPFTFTGIKDLKPYKIGVVTGYVNTAEFDAATDLQKDEVAEDLVNLKKLSAGRIDLAVIDKYVALYLIKTELPGEAGKLVSAEPSLEEKDLYLCFPKANPQSAELMKAFNEGLKKLKEDGGLKAILDKRGF